MIPAIQVQDLFKRYRKAAGNAVDGITFEVPQGEFFALLGPNGAGKTTTISILTTTLAPTSGRVLIAGHDTRREAAAVRRQAGIIFQNHSLDLNLSGEENVRLHAVLYGLYPFRVSYRLMPAGYRQQITELAEVLGLGDEIFKPARKLSGGTKRKLEIIRGLMHSPRVLFLDEPTAGLDAASRRSLWAYLAEVRARHQITIFLTTHYLEEAEQADRIGILNRGRMVALGTPAETKAQLLDRYLVVDAADRPALRAELKSAGLRFEEGIHIHVRLDGVQAHQAIRSLATPLTHLEIHQPTLEDAYLRILAESEDGVADHEGVTA